MEPSLSYMHQLFFEGRETQAIQSSEPKNSALVLSIKEKHGAARDMKRNLKQNDDVKLLAGAAWGALLLHRRQHALSLAFSSIASLQLHLPIILFTLPSVQSPPLRRRSNSLLNSNFPFLEIVFDSTHFDLSRSPPDPAVSCHSCESEHRDTLCCQASQTDQHLSFAGSCMFPLGFSTLRLQPVFSIRH
jgi:hypothetical protein